MEDVIAEQAKLAKLEEAAKTPPYVGDHIEGVSIIRWGVIPGVVVALLVFLFIKMATFGLSVDIRKIDPGCNFGLLDIIGGNCSGESVGNWWDLPLTLFISGAIGVGAGFGYYKLGLAYRKHMAAAGIVGVGASLVSGR